VRVLVRRICFDSLHHSQPGGAGSLVRAEFGMYGLYLSLQEGLYGSTSDSLALKVCVRVSIAGGAEVVETHAGTYGSYLMLTEERCWNMGAEWCLEVCRNVSPAGAVQTEWRAYRS